MGACRGGVGGGGVCGGTYLVSSSLLSFETKLHKSNSFSTETSLIPQVLPQ